MDDDDLVAAVARGDGGALRELFHRHDPWLAVRLRAVLLPAAEVEDVMQETFLGVWRGSWAYRPVRADGAAAAWLWRDLGQMASVVVPTHLVEEVGAACTDVAVMIARRIVFRDRPEELAVLGDAEGAVGDAPLERGYTTVLARTRVVAGVGQ